MLLPLREPCVYRRFSQKNELHFKHKVLSCDFLKYETNILFVIFQDDRVFPPAPDVTRRMGSPKMTIGKPDPHGSPPYYRSTSATSSSSNSVSSSECNYCKKIYILWVR